MRKWKIMWEEEPKKETKRVTCPRCKHKFDVSLKSKKNGMHPALVFLIVVVLGSLAIVVLAYGLAVL